MSKDIYSLFNCTGGEIPNAEPLDDTEVKKYMERFENDLITKRRIPFVWKSAIAASLALVMAIGGTIGYNHFSGTEEQTASPFVMTVNAEEIMPNETSFPDPRDYSLVLSENDNGIVTYCLGFKLECKGDNIKSITYTLDKDRIGIVYKGDLNPVVSGTLADISYYDGSCFEDFVNNAYTAVTFDYDNQNPEGFTFYIFGAEDSISAYQEALFSDENLEEKCEQLNNLIGNTIHCTVEYNDGTTAEQGIKIGAAVAAFSEAFPDYYNAMPEDDRPEKDLSDAFVTFTAVE